MPYEAAARTCAMKSGSFGRKTGASVVATIPAVRCIQERPAAEKPRGAPAPNALRAILAAAPELMQSICNVFIQDFLCLGYPLPDGCAVEPEAPAAR